MTAEPFSFNSFDSALQGRLGFSQPHKTIILQNATLGYWCFGSGPDLLLIHGWPLNAATFRYLVPLLSGDFRCHLIDLPGVGHSTTSLQYPYNFTQQAISLHTAMEKLGVNRFSLLAHDSGAIVARYMAEQHPDRVQALIMSDTEIPHVQSALIKILLLFGGSKFGLYCMAQFLRLKSIRQSYLGLKGCFRNPEFMNGDFYELFLRPLAQSSQVRASQRRILQQISAKEVNQLESVHRQITSPTLLLWGENDLYFPVQKARDMSKQFGGVTKVRTFANGRLFIHEEYAEEYAQHCIDFLREITEGSQ